MWLLIHASKLGKWLPASWQTGSTTKGGQILHTPLSLKITAFILGLPQLYLKWIKSISMFSIGIWDCFGYVEGRRIEMTSQQSSQIRVRRPNIPRTTTGCLCCRLRRKKCDENRPVCNGCDRNRLIYTWPQQPHPNQKSKSADFVSVGLQGSFSFSGIT